jgi:hypothetical protein
MNGANGMSDIEHVAIGNPICESDGLVPWRGRYVL